MEWSIAVAGGLLALGLWQARGHFFQPDDVISAAITVIPEDSVDLACVLPSAVGRYRCAYRTESSPWEPQPPSEDVLQPVMTETRAQYLMPGLFQQASVAQRVSSDPDNARFTASCRLRLLQILPSYKRRFRRSAPWEMAGPSWIVEPVDCKVD